MAFCLHSCSHFLLWTRDGGCTEAVVNVKRNKNKVYLDWKRWMLFKFSLSWFLSFKFKSSLMLFLALCNFPITVGSVLENWGYTYHWLHGLVLDALYSQSCMKPNGNPIFYTRAFQLNFHLYRTLVFPFKYVSRTR